MPVLGQKSIATNNCQWIQIYGQLNIGEKWQLSSDAGFRWNDAFHDPKSYLIRAGTSYQISERFKSGIGFGHFGSIQHDSISRFEFRPYQEFVFDSTFKRVKLSQRIRLEERIFTSPAFTGQPEFVLRFRYRFMLSIDLFSLSAKNEESRLFLQVGDEVFIHCGKGIGSQVFDQNRILAGPVLQFNKKLSLNLLYTYQFASQNYTSSYRNDHILWLSVLVKGKAKRAISK